MGLREQAAKGVLWSAVENGGSTLCGAVVFLLLARLLEPEAFGLLAMAMACIAIVEIVLKHGLAQALIQRETLEPEHLDIAFWASALIGTVLCVAGIAVAVLISDIFGEPRLAPVLRWLALSPLISAFGSTQQAILQRRFAFKSLAIRSLAATICGGAVGVGMALFGFGVWSLVGQMLTVGLVKTITLWMISDWRPACKASWRHFKELIAFGASIMGAEALIVLNGRVPDLLIGFFLGPVLLGYYTVGFQFIGVIIYVLTQAVATVALPTFSRLQHDAVQMRNAFSTATQISCLVGFPFFCGTLAIAPQLVDVVLGDKWGQSAPVLRVLALVGVLQAVLYFNRSVIMAAGKPSWVLQLTFVNVVTNILVIALVVRWGIVAVAVAVVVRGWVFAPLSLWLVQKVIHLKPIAILKLGAIPLLGSCVLMLSVFATGVVLPETVGPVARLSACILVGGTVYVGVIMVAAPSLVAKTRELLRLVLARPQ
ncbi:MAG: lipopolysaccharide biosynthesis protein [Planctomycetota bacterium]